ncbi:MAG: cardiolipin synthase [Firmicutes bacterium]|nr:cardiolipin synthase [Bacillota bacterium]
MKQKLRKLWRLIFGRTTMLIVLLLAQAVLLFGGFAILSSKIIVIEYLAAILSVFVLMYIMNGRLDSDFKLMWIILILAVPVVGVILYLYTRVQLGTIRIKNRIADIDSIQHSYREQNQDAMSKIIDEYEYEQGLFNYLERKAEYPVYDKASVKYFPLGEDKFRELVQQLERAEEFIFLEYFIIDFGYMWDTIREILVRKAKEGVEVRLMYDGTNSLSLLPLSYPKRLQEQGINCKVFSPMRPFLQTHQNNRDHRKIAVIDGRVAFTGGINLADEYINEKERFGHWKDVAIMVEGDAVNSFTLMFLQMWDVDSESCTDYSKYLRFGHLPELGMRNGGYIVPYGDSPMDDVLTGETVYLDIINRSTKYVHIMTPYLILDEELIDSMCYAAHRGVDVKLILPHIPDKKYAYILARTYYKELVREGVEIYEYTPGFVHAKVFTSDDIKGVVGTINLDFRSLYLHFECAAYLFRNPVIYDIEEDFQETLKKCQQITLGDCERYSKLKLTAGSLLRLVAPLM